MTRYECWCVNHDVDFHDLFIFLYFWNALWKKKKKEKDMQVLYGPSMFLLYMHYMQNTVKKMKKIRLNGI